jgi:hypothetical protein
MSIAQTRLIELVRIFQNTIVPFDQLEIVRTDIEFLVSSEVFKKTSLDVIGYYLNYQTAFGQISIKRNDFEDMVFLYSHDSFFRQHIVQSIKNLRGYIENESKY